MYFPTIALLSHILVDHIQRSASVFPISGTSLAHSVLLKMHENLLQARISTARFQIPSLHSA